jgi:hypothetical protein
MATTLKKTAFVCSSSGIAPITNDAVDRNGDPANAGLASATHSAADMSDGSVVRPHRANIKNVGEKVGAWKGIGCGLIARECCSRSRFGRPKWVNWIEPSIASRVSNHLLMLVTRWTTEVAARSQSA